MTTESNLSEIKYKDEVARPYASLHTPLRLEAYMIYDMTPGGSSTAHIYTQTIHRTTQNIQYIEQHKNF
jgi:hypothetical protein